MNRVIVACDIFTFGKWGTLLFFAISVKYNHDVFLNIGF